MGTEGIQRRDNKVLWIILGVVVVLVVCLGGCLCGTVIGGVVFPRLSGKGGGLLEMGTPEPGLPRVGFRLETVAQGSPADDGGLEVGDIIIAVDDHEFVAGEDLAVYLRRNYSPGDLVIFEVLRSGRKRTVSVVLGERLGNPDVPYLGVEYSLVSPEELE